MKKAIILLLAVVFCSFSAEEIYKNDMYLGKNNNQSDKTFCFGNGNANRGCFKYDYAEKKIRVSHDNDTYYDIGNASLSDISFTHIGNSNYKSLYDYVNITSASGVISGGTLTATGTNTVTASSGLGMVRKVNTSIDDMTFISWETTTGLSVTNDVINYAYVDYNNGNPIVAITTDITAINRNTQIVLGLIYTDGVETAHVVNAGLVVTNWIQNQHVRLTETRRVERASGIDYSETGARYLARTSGIAYLAGNRATYTSKDTSSTDRFTYLYRNGSGGWTELYDQQQISNAYYDNGTGTLASVTVGRYGVHWVYTLADGSIYVLYGQGSYTLTNAQNATVPASLPSELSTFGILSAKIIIQRNATNLYSITSAYTTPFPVSSPSDHNDLGGLQGGLTDQYYHVNSAQYAAINNNASLSVLTGTDTNVISNGFTRLDTTGWNDNANFKVSRSSSTLNLDGELVITKDADINASGQFVYYDFVMPPKYRGANVIFTWYAVGVSDYTNSYARVDIWDVTASPTQKGSSYPTNAKSSGYITFTTSASSTNYQIRVYVNNATTSAFSLALSDIKMVDADSRFTNSTIRTLTVVSGLYLGNSSGNYPLGKIPYINGGGLLYADSDLSFDGKNFSVNGNAAIGTTDVNNALLTLGAGSANANTAPIKFIYGTKMTNPESGAIEFDGTFYETKNTNFRTAFTSIMFSQTSDKTVSNSTTETSAIGGGAGSATIPANSLTVGKTIRLKLKGTIGNTGSPTGTIRVKLGSVTLVENAAALPTLSADSPFDFEYDIVVRSIGATGTVYSIGRSFVVTSAGPFMRGLDGGIDTIDTTVDNAVDVTYQWGTADPDNAITVKTASIEVLY